MYKNTIKAYKNGFKLVRKVEGRFHQIPAYFSINGGKTIEISHYINSLIDHIPIEKIFKKMQ